MKIKELSIYTSKNNLKNITEEMKNYLEIDWEIELTESDYIVLKNKELDLMLIVHKNDGYYWQHAVYKTTIYDNLIVVESEEVDVIQVNKIQLFYEFPLYYI